MLHQEDYGLADQEEGGDNMTLLETIELINNIAKEQPNINTIVETGNVFDLNADNYTAKYSAFCCEQREHVQNGDFITYNFRLYVVDRLTDDKNNKIEVQSTAINILSNIVRGLYDMELIDTEQNISYSVFTERFEAECAGAYCNVSVISAIDVCYDN